MGTVSDQDSLQIWKQKYEKKPSKIMKTFIT